MSESNVEPPASEPASAPPEFIFPPPGAALNDNRTAIAPLSTPALPPVIAEPALESHAFLFHGNEREYFRIWIVNTLLTLLTGGVFAAWAKVRKRRYFRGSTELLGHRFDYRADPWRILIGNIIVAILFVAYAVVGEVYMPVRVAAFGIAVLLLPWIVVRALAFNAHNTTYRGLRFYFRSTYAVAAYTYLVQFLLVVLSLGLLYPRWMRNRREFVVGNHRLGSAYFHFTAPAGTFYVAYIVGGAMIFGAAILGGFITTALQASSGNKVAALTDLLPFVLIYATMFFISKHYIYARLFNHVWNHTRLDDHRFRANLAVGGWLKLQLKNLVAIIGTAGLFYPFAAIRSARYALDSLQLVPVGKPIETIERLGRQEGSAIGETAGEFIGLDLGL